MATPFILVVHLHAKAEHIEQAYADCEAMLVPTRAEDGCLGYELHRDNSDPAHFMFYEVWETREHWQRHLEMPHLQAFRTATAETLESRRVFEMSRHG